MYPTRIRLSISTLELFHTCERMFQLVELLQNAANERATTPIHIFGQAWGVGIVEYLLTGKLDAAVYKMWLAYYPLLEDHQRTEELCIHGLRQAQGKLDAIRSEWEIATFNNKPAIELGFRLNINERFYFESAMDAALRHKGTGGYGVLENKHTMSWLDDITPMYKNSFQALLYSIVLDQVSGQELNSYELKYFVGQFKSSELWKPIIHVFPWKKTLLDRLNLFMTLALDVQRIQQCLDTGIFPMRGHSCLRFNRPCHFFNLCHMRKGDTPKDDAYIEKNKSSHVKEIESLVQFEFALPELINNHIARVKAES